MESVPGGNGYHAVEDVWRRAGVEPRLLRVLAEADDFATLGLSRREALWAGSREGYISAVASDHSQRRKALKEAGWKNIFVDGEGTPVLQFSQG